MPVETAKVEGRRKLSYKSFQELLDDADRVGSGPFKSLGNWSAGQIFRHLATAFNGSIDGFDVRFPLPLRVAARLLKNRLINNPMPPGIKLPSRGAEMMMPAQTSTEDGLAALHAAVSRLDQECKRSEHPVFGKLTPEEWNKVHLAHASLHMSFLIPEA
jgi:hypothetical protein